MEVFGAIHGAIQLSLGSTEPSPSVLGAISVANDQNLRPPWQPGQSGNRNGRKKGYLPAKKVLRELITRHGLDEDVAEV
jgi:hypothetical protein